MQKLTAATVFAELQGKEIALIGLGVSHRPVAKLLAQKGMKVTIYDKKSPEELGEAAKELTAMGVAFVTGADYLQKLRGDVIFRTPGMYFNHPRLRELMKAGCAVTSELELFMQCCPCPIIGVTGSDGKTTTTSLIAEMLRQSGKTVHLGGNIGRALFPELETVKPDDMAVVELSSFQLLSMRQSPEIAVVTNVTPNHLDVHGTMEEYIAAKKNIFLHQGAFTATVLNADCDYSIGHRVYHDMRYDVRGKLAEFSLEKPVTTGAYLDDNDNIVYAEDGTVTQIMPASDIRLPGRHNIANYCTAIAAVWGLVQPEQIREVARTFGGVEHRIEFVREADGVKYYNDSIATSPSRVISGVRAFNQKIIAIQGGSDKGNDLSVMVPDLLTHVKILILNGATADKIEQAVLAAPDYDPDQLQIIKVKDLAQAVEAARKAAQPGDIVSLCPACPAFDQFKTFEYRGREFKRLVNAF